MYNQSLLQQFGIKSFYIPDGSELQANPKLGDFYQRVVSMLPFQNSKMTLDEIHELRVLTTSIQQSSLQMHLLKEIDDHLPYIAFLRFYDSDRESRGYRPLEFFNLIFHDKLRGVKMIQAFVYAKGADIINPAQTCVFVDYHGPPSKYKEKVIAKNTKFHLTLLKKANKGSIPGKQQQTHPIAVELGSEDLVLYHNKPIMKVIESQVSALVRYLQQANGGVRIVYFRAKFIEQQPVVEYEGQEKCQMTFVGLIGEIQLDVHGTKLEDVYVNGQNAFFSREVRDGHDYVFSTEVIHTESKVKKTLPIESNVACAGKFCDFLDKHEKRVSGTSYRENIIFSHAMQNLNLQMNHKVREELERQQRIVPKRNQLSIGTSLSDSTLKFGKSSSTTTATSSSNNNEGGGGGSFLVTGLLIKRVNDNFDLANQILEKHFESPRGGGHDSQPAGHTSSPMRKSPDISPKGAVGGGYPRTQKQLILPSIKTPRDASVEQPRLSVTNNNSTSQFIRQLEKEGDDREKGTKEKQHHHHNRLSQTQAKPPRPDKYAPKSSPQPPAHWTPVKRKQKMVIRDSYDVLYSGIKVCRQCYQIYMLLQDYFEELNEHIAGKLSDDLKKKGINNDINKSLSYLRSSQTTSQEESGNPRAGSILEVIREARAFSHSNVDLNFLEKKKLRGGEQRNRSLIQSTISNLTVANVKGDKVLKGSVAGGTSLLKVEGFKKVGDDKHSPTSSPKHKHQKNLDLQSEGYLKPPPAAHTSVKNKLTESTMQKMKPKISLKIVQVEHCQTIQEHIEQDSSKTILQKLLENAVAEEKTLIKRLSRALSKHLQKASPSKQPSSSPNRSQKKLSPSTQSKKNSTNILTTIQKLSGQRKLSEKKLSKSTLPQGVSAISINDMKQQQSSKKNPYKGGGGLSKRGSGGDLQQQQVMYATQGTNQTSSSLSREEMTTQLGLALQSLFKKKEIKYFEDKAQNIREQRKIINFFLEVSRNIKKFAINNPFFYETHGNQNFQDQKTHKHSILMRDNSSLPHSLLANIPSCHTPSNYNAQQQEIKVENIEESKQQPAQLGETSPNELKVVQYNYHRNDLEERVGASLSKEQRRKMFNENKFTTVEVPALSFIHPLIGGNMMGSGDSIKVVRVEDNNINNENTLQMPGAEHHQKRPSLSKISKLDAENEKFANELFKGSRKASNLIMMKVHELLSEQINKIAVQPINISQEQVHHRASHSLTPAEIKLKVQHRKGAKSVRHSMLEQPRFMPNITMSLFHHYNLQHLYHVPFYRISTPKAPIYTLEEQRTPMHGGGSKRGNQSPLSKAFDEVRSTSNAGGGGGIMSVLSGAAASVKSKAEQQPGIPGFLSKLVASLNPQTKAQQQMQDGAQSAERDKLSPKNSTLVVPGKKKPFLPEEDPTGDDMYIIPQENYQTMSIENYVELLADRRYEQKMGPLTTRNMHTMQKEGCQVFFIDEYTSLVYLVLHSTSSKSTSENMMRSPSDFNSKSKQQHMDTYLVLFDFYDSFLDKVDYFQNMLDDRESACIILINLPGQQGTQYNSNKNPEPLLNNVFYSNCLDLLLYHLHERGVINFLDKQQETYTLIGFGNGANIALCFAHMMMNDTTSMLRQLVLFNPYSHLDQTMSTSLYQAIESLKGAEHNLVLLDTLLHSSESSNLLLQQNNKRNSQAMEVQTFANTLNGTSTTTAGEWTWTASTKDMTLLSCGVLQNVPLQDKLSLIKDVQPQLGHPLSIRIVYSKTNQFVSYKQIEDLIKAADSTSKMDRGKSHNQLSTQSLQPSGPYKPKLTFISGGHDALKDNPEGVLKCLEEVFDSGSHSNEKQKTMKKYESLVIENQDQKE